MLLLTGAQAGKTTNLGVNMYNTVNKMFFEIRDGTCVLLEVFAQSLWVVWALASPCQGQREVGLLPPSLALFC